MGRRPYRGDQHFDHESNTGASPPAAEDVGLASALRLASGKGARKIQQTILVILDQFEEFFHRYPSAIDGSRDKQAFGEFMGSLLAYDLPVNIMISIREDSLAGLDRFKGQIPGLFNNYLRIDHLSVSGARDAILKPLAKFNTAFPDKAIVMKNENLADAVISQILDAHDDDANRVQATSLQIVMKRWWEKEVEKRSTEMTTETLEELGEAKNIVAEYLGEVVKNVSGPKGRYAHICFYVVDRLVTPRGRRTIQTLNELTSGTDFRADDVRAVLDGLTATRILTPVPAPRGALPGELTVEFAHDLIAKAAANMLAAYRERQKLDRLRKEERKARREAAQAKARANEMEKLRQDLESAQRLVFDPPAADSAEISRLRLEVGSLKSAYRELVFQRSAVIGLPREGVWPEIFALMPFSPSMDMIYREHIVKAAANFGARTARAEDLLDSTAVIKDIWSAIHAARVVIADCTGRNPNVFYELGLAHAIGRQAVLISQTIDDIPFDLRHLMLIHYDHTPAGLRVLDQALASTLGRFLGKTSA